MAHIFPTKYVTQESMGNILLVGLDYNQLDKDKVIFYLEAQEKINPDAIGVTTDRISTSKFKRVEEFCTDKNLDYLKIDIDNKDENIYNKSLGIGLDDSELDKYINERSVIERNILQENESKRRKRLIRETNLSLKMISIMKKYNNIILFINTNMTDPQRISNRLRICNNYFQIK